MPVVTGRQAWGLSRAERKLGHKSDLCVFEQHPYVAFPADRVLFESSDSLLVREIKRWRFFYEAVLSYDVFHFHFSEKFFVLQARFWKEGDSPKERILRFFYGCYSLVVGQLDLLILKLLGKKIFMTFHGDDIRQGDRSLEWYQYSIASEVDHTYYEPYTDRRKRRVAKVYARYCQQIFTVTPDLNRMSPPGAICIRHTGVDLEEWKPVITKNPRPLIVHAPTHRGGKGSRFVLGAIENLKARGFDFDFILIEKMSNAEARQYYERADLLVDQLLAGWYGLLAVELMAMAKPVVCYIRQEDLQGVPREMASDLPIIKATRDEIEERLEWCLKNLEELKAIGRRSRAFVEKWHDPDKIAREVLEYYQK